MKASSVLVITAVLSSLLLASGAACAQRTQKPSASPDQQKAAELMKSRGMDASLTIFPIGLPVGRDFRIRVSEAVGWILEHQGLKNIELGKTVFDPGTPNWEQVAIAFSEFVKNNRITTEYALYAEYGFDLQAVDKVRAVVVDKQGTIVWTDRVTSQDEALKKVTDPDAMGYSVLLVERLSPQLSLNEETVKAAKPGKMAQIMAERSALPPESERAPLPERQKRMMELGPKATLVIYPARIGGDRIDTASAANLARLINEAGLCKATVATHSVLLKSSLADPNELRKLWLLAGDFRKHVRENPPDADYVVYADYIFNPELWQGGMVHFVVCDRKGEWVIVDLQNSLQPDYRSIKPTTREACDKLLLKRLESYLCRQD